jgi:hypothetical protein
MLHGMRVGAAVAVLSVLLYLVTVSEQQQLINCLACSEAADCVSDCWRVWCTYRLCIELRLASKGDVDVCQSIPCLTDCFCCIGARRWRCRVVRSWWC